MTIIILLAFFLFLAILYRVAVKIATKQQTKLSRNNSNFGIYISLWAFIPSFIIFIAALIGYNFYIKQYLLDGYITIEHEYLREAIYYQILKIASLIKSGEDIDAINIFTSYDITTLKRIAIDYLYYKNIVYISLVIFSLSLSTMIAFFVIKKVNFQNDFQKKVEKFIENVLLIFAGIAVLTTTGIILSLVVEAFKFFQEVSIFKFLFGTKWYPESADVDAQNSFGVLPLLSGTFLISFIAVLTATIIGVSSAIYTAEYMPKTLRKIIKPMLEILAGIPSIVYGFFAAVTFAPFLIGLFKSLGIVVPSENALSAGVVMGIMIIPFVSSITDDVLSSLPRSLREGAIAMGSMKNEVIRKVLVPAAMPGILAGVLLAVSRAIGETMIVVMAASLAANLTLNPLEPVTTITTQIVMLVQGDQEFNSPKTLSAFALGLLLFILTLILNIIALKIVSRYKGKHA